MNEIKIKLSSIDEGKLDRNCQGVIGSMQFLFENQPIVVESHFGMKIDKEYFASVS